MHDSADVAGFWCTNDKARTAGAPQYCKASGPTAPGRNQAFGPMRKQQLTCTTIQDISPTYLPMPDDSSCIMHLKHPHESTIERASPSLHWDRPALHCQRLITLSLHAQDVCRAEPACLRSCITSRDTASSRPLSAPTTDGPLCSAPVARLLPCERVQACAGFLDVCTPTSGYIRHALGSLARSAHACQKCSNPGWLYAIASNEVDAMAMAF